VAQTKNCLFGVNIKNELVAKHGLYICLRGKTIACPQPYSDTQYPFSHKLTYQAPYTKSYQDVTWNFNKWHI